MNSEANEYKDKLRLLSELIDSFELEPDTRPDYFNDLLSYFLKDRASSREILAAGIEVIIHYNDPLQEGWITFQAVDREHKTYFFTYCDDFEEGVTISYLKLCRSAERRL